MDRSYFEKTVAQHSQPDRKMDTMYGKLSTSQNYTRKK
jgi:hypothetical protein